MKFPSSSNVRAAVAVRLRWAAGFAAAMTCVAPVAISASGDVAALPTDAESAVSDVRKPQLKSITLSPATFSGPPGATQQVQVTGTYRAGKSHVIKTGDEYFSSNTAVATVSSTGLVTILAGTGVGDTAIISATNKATGISTGTGEETAVTVGTPSPSSINAATTTAANNTFCHPLGDFYWEIGDQKAPIASGSIGTTYDATTSLEIDSASKLLYAAYVVQTKGGVSALNTNDIGLLHFTSGYTNMPEESTTSVCPPVPAPGDTVNACLALKDPEGYSYGGRNMATEGVFDYNSGHMEKHASLEMNLGNVDVHSLGPVIAPILGAGVSFIYTEPLMAGGVTTTPVMYALVLRNILSGSLDMRDALGTNAVCTLHSDTCNAYPGGSFIPEAWHYSIGHWVEDDSSNSADDGAFSSPGAEGFYPWIDRSKTYYGIVAHSEDMSAYMTAECGRAIRQAFMTGVPQ
jgi:hypothetical protein